MQSKYSRLNSIIRSESGQTAQPWVLFVTQTVGSTECLNNEARVFPNLELIRI